MNRSLKTKFLFFLTILLEEWPVIPSKEFKVC